MKQGLENASKAMRNKLQNIQIVANNLANVNTTGFKKGLAFSDVLDQESANIRKEVTDFSEGVFMETNSPLHAAISGRAFFAIKTPEGNHLTRNGDFIIDKQGFLASREGYRVLGQNGEINLLEELTDNPDISITKNGEIKSGDNILTKLKIMQVDDELKLRKASGQRFYTDDKQYTHAAEKDYEIHHGYLESSNTNAIVEMQSMIQLQKDFEASQKMITTIDTILGQVKEMGKV